MIEAILYGAVVGISLGLTGGGGSIFAVPLLVFALGMPMRDAVIVSLLIVGIVSMFGAFLQTKSGAVLWGAGAVLGLGGIFFAPVGAKLGALLSAETALLAFAVLMALIGLKSLWGSKNPAQEVPFAKYQCERTADGAPKFSTACAAKLFFAGGITGVLSGMFGVGGGFLIAPTLLLLTGISFPRALATSLVGIALISFSGFFSNLFLAGSLPPLGLSVWFLGGAFAGMTVGSLIKPLFPPAALRMGFGVVVLSMAMLVAWRALGG